MNALDVLCAQLTRDRFAIAKFLFCMLLAFDAPVKEVQVGILPSRLMWKNYNGGATRW